MSSGRKNQYTSRAASRPVSVESEWPRIALIAAYVGFVMDGTMPLLEPGVDSDCPEEGCMGSIIGPTPTMDAVTIGFEDAGVDDVAEARARFLVPFDELAFALLRLPAARGG